MDFLQLFLQNMMTSPVIEGLVIVLLLDTFLGSIRAIKEKKWNSTVGINGILRKIAMIGSIIFLQVSDMLVHIDLLGFVPRDILNYIGLTKVGTCELFGIMFILYEITSILKNMILCGLPIPKGLKEKIEKLLKDMTTEIDNKDNQDEGK